MRGSLQNTLAQQAFGPALQIHRVYNRGGCRGPRVVNNSQELLEMHGAPGPASELLGTSKLGGDARWARGQAPEEAYGEISALQG